MNHRHVSTIADYAAVIGRRKRIVLPVLLLVPAAVVALSLLQHPLYEAKAQVLLNRQSLASTLAGTTDPTIFQEPERVVQTQAKVAAVPEVARRAAASVPSARVDAQELLDNSSISPEPNVDLLEFTVRHRRPAAAMKLATAYARAYTAYRNQVETAALAGARADVQARIQELRRSGAPASSIQSLLDKEQQLLTLETLQTANASVVQEADKAEKVQPRPVRNAAVGVALGLALALLLAFLADALDTRVRSSDELSEALDLTLLGRLPPPPRLLRRAGGPVILADPDSAASEAFRTLRTNVDFANIDLGARTIMVTSAVEDEGKSTTAVSLAAAYAVAGRRVVLVELDLRRPSFRRFFHIERYPGVSDVVLGNAALEDALARVPLDARTQPPGNGRRPPAQRGGLYLLHAGATPPNPGDFVGSRAVRALLGQLSEQADLVLVDAPPLLRVGDAVTLSADVDAVLLVVKLKQIMRRDLAEARRVLETTRAPVLGFIVTNAKEAARYGYGRGGRRLHLGRRHRGEVEPYPRPSAPRPSRTPLR